MTNNIKFFLLCFFLCIFFSPSAYSQAQNAQGNDTHTVQSFEVKDHTLSIAYQQAKTLFEAVYTEEKLSNTEFLMSKISTSTENIKMWTNLLDYHRRVKSKNIASIQSIIDKMQSKLN